MTVQLELPVAIQVEAERLATQNGVSLEELLSRAIEQFAAEECREDEILQARLAEADRGEFLTETEMDARVEQMLQGR